MVQSCQGELCNFCHIRFCHQVLVWVTGASVIFFDVVPVNILCFVWQKLQTPTQVFFCKFCKLFEVASVVNLKLAFTVLFIYNLIIQIKLYKIQYLNLGKSLLLPRNQCYSSEELKHLTSSNNLKVYHFKLKVCTRFLLNNVCKKMFKIFLFC